MYDAAGKFNSKVHIRNKEYSDIDKHYGIDIHALSME